MNLSIKLRLFLSRRNQLFRWGVSMLKIKSEHLNNQRGLSILVVLFIVISLTVSLQMAIFNLSAEYRKNQKRWQISSSRDNLAEKLSKYVSSGILLRNSIQIGLSVDNSKFRSCLLGLPKNSCDSRQDVPIAIYDLDSQNQYRLAVAPQGSNLKAYYDLSGNICSSTQVQADPNSCPFLVTSTFRPVCPAFMAVCSIAAYVTVKHVVSVIDGYASSHGAVFSSVEKMSNLIPVTSILPSDVNDLQITDVNVIGGGTEQVTVTVSSNSLAELEAYVKGRVGKFDPAILSVIVAAGFDASKDKTKIADLVKNIASHNFTTAADIKAYLDVWKKDPELAETFLVKAYDGGVKSTNIAAFLSSTAQVKNRALLLGLAANVGGRWSQPYTLSYVTSIMTTITSNSITNVKLISAIADNRVSSSTTIANLNREVTAAQSQFNQGDYYRVSDYVDKYVSGATLTQAISSVNASFSQDAQAYAAGVKNGTVKTGGVTQIAGSIPTMTTTTTRIVTSAPSSSYSSINACVRQGCNQLFQALVAK